MTQSTPLAFLQLLYKGSTPPISTVEFRLLPSRKQVWMPWPAFEGHPDEFKNIPTDQDTYFGISLRKDNTAGGAKNVHPTHLTWVDIDLKGTPWTGGQTDVLNMTAEELKDAAHAAFAHYLAQALALNLPPRAVVYTGHGLQIYWARRARSTLADTEDFNRRLAATFDGDPKTVDPARIFRVPGSQNLKNLDRPLTVELWREDADAWVEDAALGALALPEKVRPEPTPNTDHRTPNLTDGESVISQWNQRNPIGMVLERYGYVREDSKTYTRPGDDASGRDVRLLENKRGVLCSYHHSSNDPLHSTSAATEHLLEPFDLWVHYEHSGDFKVAARAAAVELGLSGGSQRKPPTRGTISGNVGGAGELAQAVAGTLPDKPSLAQYRDLVLASFAEAGILHRYHQVWRSWWRYDQGVYEEVPDEVMSQLVDLTLQAFGHTVKNTQISEIMTKIARDAGIGSREVDQGPWQLNTRSGVLDLESGELYEHTPEYFSIIQSAAFYRPESVAHHWQDFLRQAVPSEGDRSLLQQFAGLCLTGDTSPQKALLLIGEGGTGKGTFTRVLNAVLGNLATSSAIENIKDGSFLVGTLVGKRMCTVSELPRSFDWLPFKRITGEDQISIDVKNKTPYTTKLDMKLVILSNVMPFLGDDTSNTSLMRRFLPVAFNVKPPQVDPMLETRLTHEEELPGVLNWMLEGLRLLREAGMRFPNSDATTLAREIVEESNPVISFLRDECSYVPEVTVQANDLYDAYRKWSSRNGHGVLSAINFSKRLLSAGRHFDRPLDKTRTKTSRLFVNLMLSNSPGGWEE